MANLAVQYAGLNLKNPIIASSSGMTVSAECVARLEEAGAGAVVLKSIFEEQILRETDQMVHESAYGDYGVELFEWLKGQNLNAYLELIRTAKQACSIPVIASINCALHRSWVDFAAHIEQAGADALEINVLSVQSDVCPQWGAYEQMHLDILEAVRKKIRIPVIMKIGSNLTNPVALADQLAGGGASGLVLFNRFYQPDIDIDTLSFQSGPRYSTATDFANTLRWTGIISAAVKQLDIAASGGVYSAENAIKQLLAGATVLEICSVLYTKGFEEIGTLLGGINDWMDQKGYESIGQFRGLMNAAHLEAHSEVVFERTQFLKYFGNAGQL